MTDITESCPCGSKQTYANCCQPLHEQNTYAKTAEQLMRSRYSAFVHKLSNYLLNTHHKDYHSRDEESSLKKTFTKIRWVQLAVIQYHEGTQKDNAGTVEFKAYHLENNKLKALHACSNFIKQNGCWFYTDDSFCHSEAVKTGRNDLCWCNSGKKYKKCHGAS